MSDHEQGCLPCQCTEPGWCERHQRRKTPHLFQLCQTQEKYRRLWDAQAAAPNTAKPRPPKTIENLFTRKSPFSTGKKVLRYTKAVARWIKAGRPVRPPAEVARIYGELCRPCNDFDREKQTCRNCGCRVRKSAGALRNKIAMATEHCRRDKW